MINANSIIFSLRDHNGIKCVRKLSNIKFNLRTIKCRDYKNYDQTTVSVELSVENWDIVYNTPEPDMTWNNLQQILSETINRHAPLINKCVKATPWLKHWLEYVQNYARNTDWNMYKTTHETLIGICTKQHETTQRTLYGVHKKPITSLSWEILKKAQINSGKWSKLCFQPKQGATCPIIQDRCQVHNQQKIHC